MVGTNAPERLYFYDLEVSYDDEVSAGPRASPFAAPYPLSSASLREAFHNGCAHADEPTATVRIRPDHPDVRLGVGLNAQNLLPEVTIRAGESAVPFFDGLPDWAGRFTLTNAPPERWPCAVPSEADEPEDADDCACGSLADDLDATRPRLRIPLGEPSVGAVSGFVWLDLSESTSVSLNSVNILAGAGVTSATNAQTGAITVTAPAPQGRTVLATNTVADDANPLRNGRLRAVTSNRRAWAWYDYDALGREICRIEQLDGSGFPETLSEISTNAPLASAARITATSYEPAADDSCHANDRDLPRRAETFVCRRIRNSSGVDGVDEPLLTDVSTWAYVRETDAAGVPLRRTIHTTGLGTLTRTDEARAYPDDHAVPTWLRGRTVWSRDEDGREQLTGFSDVCRSRTVTVGADGVVSTNVVVFDSATQVETETFARSTGERRVTRRVCGLVLEEETDEEVTATTYDAQGRVAKVERRRPTESAFTPVEARTYSAMGDLVRRDVFTNATAFVSESFAYDHEGRVVAATNALGNVVLTDYDARGNPIAEDGATYPVRRT